MFVGGPYRQPGGLGCFPPDGAAVWAGYSGPQSRPIKLPLGGCWIIKGSGDAPVLKKVKFARLVGRTKIRSVRQDLKLSSLRHFKDILTLCDQLNFQLNY